MDIFEQIEQIAEEWDSKKRRFVFGHVYNKYCLVFMNDNGPSGVVVNDFPLESEVFDFHQNLEDCISDALENKYFSFQGRIYHDTPTRYMAIPLVNYEVANSGDVTPKVLEQIRKSCSFEGGLGYKPNRHAKVFERCINQPYVELDDYPYVFPTKFVKRGKIFVKAGNFKNKVTPKIVYLEY